METKPSEIFDWLGTEVSAIDCVYRGDPRHDRDAYWMRDEVQRLIEHARKAFPDAAASKTATQRDELLEALKTTKMWLQKLQPAMNVMCSECLDDIIRDQIDAAIARATGASS